MNNAIGLKNVQVSKPDMIIYGMAVLLGLGIVVGPGALGRGPVHHVRDGRHAQRSLLRVVHLQRERAAELAQAARELQDLQAVAPEDEAVCQCIECRSNSARAWSG